MLSPGASPVIGAATTLHVGLALLRNHRRHGGLFSPVVLISFAFVAAPWIVSTPAGLALGLGVHLLWFVACEHLLAPGLALPAATGNRHLPTAETRRPGPPVEHREAGGGPARPAPSGAPASRPKGFVQAPVIATFEETSAIKTFRIARPEGFDFEAGQFLAIRVRVDGQELVRCYSISSAPDVRGYLEISVKRQGVVSQALHAATRPGALLWVKAPAGAFRYPSGDDRPILLLAGGVGVTPLISMLRHAVATEPTRPVAFIYSAHAEADLAFRDELETIGRRHPQVRMCFAASDASRPNVYHGRIDEALLRLIVPGVADWVAYVCGPGPMIDATRALLAAMGVPGPQIRFERFEAAMAIARGDGAEEAPERHCASAAGYEMVCARRGACVTVGPSQSILEAAELAGVEVPSLCRAGVCGTCRVRVTSGDVHCPSTTLDDEERKAGYVLACVSTLASDCTVQL